MESFWGSVHGISLVAMVFSVLWLIYILVNIKTDKNKKHKYIILSVIVFVCGIIFSIVGSVQKDNILSKKNKHSITLTQKDSQFKTDDDGYFVLKGKVIWPATIKIVGTGKNKNVKPVTKNVEAGNFKIKLRKQKANIDPASYRVKASYDNGYYYNDWTFKVENYSDARFAYLNETDSDEDTDTTSDDSSTDITEAITSSQSKNPADYQTGTTYEQVARTPDDYEWKKVQFSGEVAQVLEDDEETQIRLAVNGDYDSMMLIDIDNDILDGKRILENDQVTISGLSLGTTTYESTMGGNITIPAMEAVIVNNNSAQ